MADIGKEAAVAPPEKEVGTDPNAVHNEKMAIHDSDAGSGDDGGRRRSSVAGNIVHNPLARLSKGHTIEQAQAFATGFGMEEHADLFARAALIARDPDRFEMLTDLKEDERAALIYERDHKWHGPKMLWYSIGLCAVGAATQGWDQTGSNGANLSFPQAFGIDGPGKDEWIVGVINSIIFLTAGLIGAFIVDPLNKYLGRRGEIFVTALCLTATPIGSVLATLGRSGHLPRFLRQRHCQGHRRHLVASPARLCLHPQLGPRHRHLLLPRVASLAHEARQGRTGLQIHVCSPRSQHNRRP